MQLQIPQRITDLLRTDHSLNAQVSKVIDRLEPILDNNRTPFFPEYTDHGLKHVESVLRAAWSLATDEAREHFSPGDAALLVLAVLFHDLAMHLTEDGFITLVSPQTDWSVTDELGDTPWPQLWTEFCAQARRFSGRELKNIFGNTEPADLPLPADTQQWNERHRKLIGEFLRRHHHQLAHQMANNGMPGPLGKGLKFDLQTDLADLAGLVARSHGMPLRDSLPYLEAHYHRVEYKKIHAVFLMSLLRIADFLQIESERAPTQLLAVKTLRSPISQREWSAHTAVEDIQLHEDPESRFVRACPHDVKTFLRLRDLLHDLQAELDTSWAVLGEVYGRYTNEGLNKLGLTLRRIRSNLDDVKKFAETVDYVPCRARFDTAGAELMNLLVEPLYGDNPYIGVRELLQNAVDAVRELEDYLDRFPTPDIERPDLPADVLISLTSDQEGRYFLTVEDRGIGMTPDTLQRYFLTAGASLRTSPEWRKNFEDAQGHSRVLRSGRFGIGVFAALLLGDSFHVSTRHVTNDTALEFSASLAHQGIEFRKCTRPFGTSISVQISEPIAFKLLSQPERWAWFVLESPTVHRKVNLSSWDGLKNYLTNHRSISLDTVEGQIAKLQRLSSSMQDYFPAFRSKLPPEWHRVSHPLFSDIHWRYTPGPSLAHNGIIVGNQFSNSWGPNFESPLSDAFLLKLPTCSVFDPDGNLPLNLQRTSPILPYPFEANLTPGVLRDILAFALVNAPTMPLNHIYGLKTYLRYHPAFHRDYEFQFLPFVPANNGAFIPESTLLCNALGNSPIGLLFTAADDDFFAPADDELFSSLSTSEPICALVAFTRADERVIAYKADQFTRYPNPIACRWACNRALVPDHPYLNHWNHWDIGANDRCDGPDNVLDFLKSEIATSSSSHLAAVVQWYFDPENPPQESPLAKCWNEIIRHPVIPYDLQERRAVLAHAYEELDEYVRRWTAIRDRDASTLRP